MRLFAAAIATGLVFVFTANSFAYPLTLEQRKRFKRYLPGTFPKLEAKEPVHFVVLGDSVTGAVSYTHLTLPTKA